MFGGLDDMPSGLFSFFLNLWEVLHFWYIEIVGFLSEHTIEILGYGSFNVIAFMLGSGLTVFLVVVLIRFVRRLFIG